MKLPDIDYARPTSLDSAVRLLADADSRILAGGQSLIPMMAYRLVTPSLLVDIARIPGLDRIGIGADGVTLGARVRWRDIENDPLLATRHPLLCAGVSHIAHYQIRNRGTVGGSLAHADPAAELPAIVLACDAVIVVFGADDLREVAARDFFVGPLTTALQPTDIITEIRLPAWPAGRKFAFEEFARRRGDFALAGVCLAYDLNEHGAVVDPRVVCFGATEIPMRIAELEQFLRGRQPDLAMCEGAARVASDAITSVGDIHASPTYRRSLFGTLVERALLKSMSRTAGDAHGH
jgi:aerobic carbon-monoxide dehydrogenase medium subunit